MITAEQLADLLREAERAHGEYEARLGRRDDDWPTWYARHMLPKLRDLLSNPTRPDLAPDVPDQMPLANGQLRPARACSRHCAGGLPILRLKALLNASPTHNRPTRY